MNAASVRKSRVKPPATTEELTCCGTVHPNRQSLGAHKLRHRQGQNLPVGQWAKPSYPSETVRISTTVRR